MKWKRTAGLLLFAVWGLSPVLAWAEDPDCFYCGMRQEDTAHSWIELRYPGGERFGFCSLHCAAIHMALHPEDVPQEILVGEYLSHRPIDADGAYWVIGGSKPGVMTARAKWAFARREDAEQFIAQYGGRLATMPEALRAATEDMYQDIRTIQEKRNAARERTMKQNRE